MKSVYSLLASAFTLVAGSIHAAPPFQPQYVEAFVAERQTDATTTKLRITAVNSEAQTAETVALGSIAACTASACYRVAGATPALSLPNTSSGTSAQIVEMAVPRQPILSIHIEGGAGSNVIPSAVALPGPLDLSLSTAGGEVLLVFKKQGDAKSPKFAPMSSASGLLRDHGISVYYHPSSTTTKLLPGGVEIVIPAAATAAPQIFNVAVLDTGDAYPMLDIFPPMKLLKRGTVTMLAPMKGAAKGVSSTNGTDATVRTQKSFGETGVVRPNAADLPQSKSVSGNASSVTSTTACAQALSQAYLQLIQTMGFTGVVYTDICANIPPYVHIVLANKSFVPTTQLALEKGPSSVGPDNRVPWMELKKITSYPSPNSRVIVNGFTWEGDIGITANNHGYALGYVEEGAFVYGLNKVGGGARLNDSQDGVKRGMIWVKGCEPAWGTGAGIPLFNGYCNYQQPWIIVSSSTSIVNNGICSTDTLTRPWSAFGTTGVGHFIFMSSASGTSTNAAEMCPPLVALGSNNVIRMDGNTAAGMVVDNTHKNPITGADSFIFGTARHVAYGIRFSSVIGTTPTVSPPPRVPPPTNPCIKNPAACARGGSGDAG